MWEGAWSFMPYLGTLSSQNLPIFTNPKAPCHEILIFFFNQILADMGDKFCSFSSVSFISIHDFFFLQHDFLKDQTTQLELSKNLSY